MLAKPFYGFASLFLVKKNSLSRKMSCFLSAGGYNYIMIGYYYAKFYIRFSAAVLSLAVALTAVVFDVPGKLFAKAEATEETAAESQNCKGESDHGSMTPWSDTTTLPNTTGKYYLTDDIDCGVRTIGSGVDITICLNGHKISTIGTAKHLITIDGGSLTLCDCQGGVLTGGYFDDSRVFEFGAAVYVKGGGSFTLNGGTISENKSLQKGGAVGGQ